MPNHIFGVHVHMWSLKEKNKVMHPHKFDKSIYLTKITR